jgi:NAD(P)H dehydrogenase (quinone)
MKNEMKVPYVYAHPEPKSFNAALKDTALDALKEKGHVADIPTPLSKIR